MTSTSESFPPREQTLSLALGNKDRQIFIADRRFIKQLNEIHQLKQFLFEEKVKFDPAKLGSIDLGELNNLGYRPTGRLPTPEEWLLLDEKLTALTAYLDDELRPKIRIRQLATYFGILPLALLFIVAISTIAYALYPYILTRGTLAWYAVFYMTMLIWTISQGALGACAYLGTRITLKKGQDTSTSDLLGDAVDITDLNVLRMRIILGSLFAFVIGLPLSLQALNNVSNLLFDSSAKPTAADFAFILAPFLLGFSTNLVLAILSRGVASIQTFFGISSSRG
jgi:hypothetical protein